MKQNTDDETLPEYDALESPDYNEMEHVRDSFPGNEIHSNSLDNVPLQKENSRKSYTPSETDISKENDANNDLPTNIPSNIQSNAVKRNLYISHGLTAWGWRMWEFGAALILAATWKNSLLLPSVFGLCETIAAVLFGGLVGEYIDMMRHDRLKVVKRALLGQNFFIILSVTCAIVLLSDVLESQGSSISTFLFGVLVTLLIIFGCVARVASIASNIAVEKDWVPLVTAGNDDELSNMNAIMRRIDLVCKIGAPLIVSLIITWNPLYGAIFIGLWNLFGYKIEMMLLERAFKSIKNAISEFSETTHYNDEEATRHDVGSTRRDVEATRHDVEASRDIEVSRDPCILYETDMGTVSPNVDVQPISTTGQSTTTEINVHPKSTAGQSRTEQSFQPSISWREIMMKPFHSLTQGWYVYYHSPISSAGISLALLYISVLQFGSVMNVVIDWTGTPIYTLAIFRGLGALFGILATTAYPRMRAKVGVDGAALIASWSQVLCLFICFCIVPYTMSTDITGTLSPLESTDHTTNRVPIWTTIIFMLGVSISRFGLWGFDLGVTQLLQSGVQQKNRGQINGVQNSLNMFCGLAEYGMGLIFSYPGSFGYPTILSYIAIIVAALLFGRYVEKGGYDAYLITHNVNVTNSLIKHTPSNQNEFSNLMDSDSSIKEENYQNESHEHKTSDTVVLLPNTEYNHSQQTLVQRNETNSKLGVGLILGIKALYKVFR